MPSSVPPTARMLLPATLTALCLFGVVTTGQGPLSPSGTISVLVNSGDYVGAQARAERSVAAAPSPAERDIAAEILLAVLLLNGRGCEASTRELAEGLVRARRTAGAPSSELATSLRQLGDVLLQRADYGPAVAAYREAVVVREQAGGAGTLQLAEDLEHLAVALTDDLVRQVTSFDEALPLIERAIAIRRAAVDDSGTARSLAVRGQILQGKGDYMGARADFEASLAWFEGTHPSHPDTAMALRHLGEQLDFDGALARSERMLTRACAMTEATLRPGHPDVGYCLRALALVREEAGDLVSARELRERGLSIAEQALGRDHPRVAMQLNDLANTSLLQGEFAAARSLYERARETYERRQGPDSNGATAAVYNLALMATQLGDYAEARRGLERVIGTWTRVLGPEHPDVARGLAALAETLAEQGRDSEARQYFTRALRIRERALGTDHPYVARTLSALAATLARIGLTTEALARSTRSLEIWERSGAQSGMSEALVIHAQILSRAGDLAGAEANYRRALDLSTTIFGAAHPTVASQEVSLAAVEAQLGRTTETVDRGLRGQRIAREHALLTLSSLPERQALEYARTWPKGLDIALSFAGTPADHIAALDEVIRGRALTLDEMSLRRRAAADAESGETRALWDRLRSARQRLANLVVRGPRNDMREHAALVDEARRAKEEAERALAERSAVFRTNERRNATGLADVRSALPDGTALVSFYRYDRTVVTAATSSGRPASVRTVPSYMAFVLRDAGDPVSIPLGSAASIDAAIESWRDELVTGGPGNQAALQDAERSLRVIGAALRRRIWDPIARHLDGAARVFVVPDSGVNLVPIAALPSPRGGYLVEHAPVIHYLSAERDLAAPEPSRAAAAGSLLAIGGPSFSSGAVFAALQAPAGRAQPPQRTAPAPAPPATLLATRASAVPATCATFRNMQFDPLPAARAEAEEVAALWTTARGSTVAAEDMPARILVGGVASETAFKQLAPGRRVLHLATHGFFLGDECDTPPASQATRAVGAIVGSQPPAPPRPPAPPSARPARRAAANSENPLLLSGLALAGANRRAAAGPNEDDGILTAEEVAGLDLTGVDWAVLSACETGLGLVRVGEGVLGLRRAFQTAGARTVIMSLWSVEDRATRQWMRALYRGRFERGLDTADAVQQAALTTLRARRAAGQSGHPFFWAGFAAAGDWR